MLLATERWESAAADCVCSQKTMGGQVHGALREMTQAPTTKEKVIIIYTVCSALLSNPIWAHLSVNKRRFKDTFTRARAINLVYLKFVWTAEGPIRRNYRDGETHAGFLRHMAVCGNELVEFVTYSGAT